MWVCDCSLLQCPPSKSPPGAASPGWPLQGRCVSQSWDLGSWENPALSSCLSTSGLSMPFSAFLGSLAAAGSSLWEPPSGFMMCRWCFRQAPCFSCRWPLGARPAQMSLIVRKPPLARLAMRCQRQGLRPALTWLLWRGDLAGCTRRMVLCHLCPGQWIRTVRL